MRRSSPRGREHATVVFPARGGGREGGHGHPPRTAASSGCGRRSPARASVRAEWSILAELASRLGAGPPSATARPRARPCSPPSLLCRALARRRSRDTACAGRRVRPPARRRRPRASSRRSRPRPLRASRGRAAGGACAWAPTARSGPRRGRGPPSLHFLLRHQHVEAVPRRRHGDRCPRTAIGCSSSDEDWRAARGPGLGCRTRPRDAFVERGLAREAGRTSCGERPSRSCRIPVVGESRKARPGLSETGGVEGGAA